VACEPWTLTAGASDVGAFDDELDFVAEPIANAAANAMTTAPISNSQRVLTDDRPVGCAVAPKLVCTAAPRSIVNALRSRS